MKKLMFVVAMTAGICMADVQSSNIVGYNEINLDAGFTSVAGTFCTVGDEGIDIQAIKLVGDGVTSGADTLQLLNENSVATEIFTWATGWDSPHYDAEGNPVDCWMNAGWDDWEVRTLSKGTGMLINTQNPGCKIRCSGEVRKEASFVTLGAGFTMLGNTTPVDVDIQKIRLLDGDDPTALVTSGADTIQFLNDESVANEIYTWATGWDSPHYDEEGNPVDCWMNAGWDDWQVMDVTAGRAFLINVQNAGVKIKLPAYNE